MSKSHGELTVELARKLQRELPNHDVLFDHGVAADNTGHIVSYFDRLSADTQLAQLDIAVVDKASGKCVALVEVEESSATPKVLLADAFAVLAGDAIDFKRMRLNVGEFTSLFIIFAADRSREARTEVLAHRIATLKAALQTGNASILKVYLKATPLDQRIDDVASWLRSAITAQASS